MNGRFWLLNGGVHLLLDLYPNAAASYSLRLLRSGYTGSAIRVRRSSDNAESDIGFSDLGLDTTALLNFVGAGNGFVTTWYDQSGNGRNATQTTAGNQPQIVSSGSVITANSKPTLRFDGINDGLSLGTQTVGVSTMIQVVKRNGAANGFYHPIFTATSAPNYTQSYTPNSTNTVNLFQNAAILNTGQTFNTVLQCFQSYMDTTMLQYQNNSASATQSATFSPQTIGSFQLAFWFPNFFNGDFSEFIWYANSQLTNQSGIYTNLNSYYSF